MSSITIGLILIGVLFALVLMGMRIAVALMAVAFAGVWIIRGNFDLSMRLMSIATYNGVANYLFATIPLFVLMGHLVSISNVGKDTFDVAEALLRRHGRGEYSFCGGHWRVDCVGGCLYKSCRSRDDATWLSDVVLGGDRGRQFGAGDVNSAKLAPDYLWRAR